MGGDKNIKPSLDIKKLIDKYDNDCQDYFNKIYPGLKRILREGQEKYKRYIELLYHLHIFQNYLLEDEKKYFKTSPNTCISSFYAKSASDALCLYQCLNQGQIISSMSIERNIFESFVNLKLILEKDTSERIKLYEEFGFVQVWTRIEEYRKYLKIVENNPNFSDEFKQKEKEQFEITFDEELINITTENYERIKENYLKVRPFHWAWKLFKDEIPKGTNPSFIFICKKLGIEKLYIEFYSLNSVVVHSQPIVSQVLMQHNGISSAPNFNDSIKNIAETSSSLVIEIILMILHYAKSPAYDEIKNYLSEKWLSIF